MALTTINLIILTVALLSTCFSVLGLSVPPCFTNDLPSKQCVFPFKYGGVNHQSCITEDGSADWCYTENTIDVPDSLTGASWGYCDCTHACGCEVKTTVGVGELCQGFNGVTSRPYPECNPGLVCEPRDDVSIPGHGNSCREEACIIVDCAIGDKLIGKDSRGCGGHCVPCVAVTCSPGFELVGSDPTGCGGTCEKKGSECAMVLCAQGWELVDTDSRGCGGTCQPTTCTWSEHKHQSCSGGFADGVSKVFDTREEAKNECIRLGRSKCKAVSCTEGFLFDRSCTVWASSALLDTAFSVRAFVPEEKCFAPATCSCSSEGRRPGLDGSWCWLSEDKTDVACTLVTGLVVVNNWARCEKDGLMQVGCSSARGIAPRVATNTNSSVTATVTGMDSSASSGSSQWLGSLKSVGSGPAGSSSSGDSFNTGSSLSDSFGSASSGYTASGSWGSQLQIWQWVFLLGLVCCCFAFLFCASMCPGGKKRGAKAKKPKARGRQTPAAASLVMNDVEVAPLIAVPGSAGPLPMMPLAASSVLMPSYSIVAPQSAAYAPGGMYAPYAHGYTSVAPPFV